MHNPVESFLVGQIVTHKPTGELCVVKKIRRDTASVKIKRRDGRTTYVDVVYEKLSNFVDWSEWGKGVKFVFHAPSGCTACFEYVEGNNVFVSFPGKDGNMAWRIMWKIADCRPMSEEWLSFARDAISKK